jgi:hypothetical protein
MGPDRLRGKHTARPSDLRERADASVLCTELRANLCAAAEAEARAVIIPFPLKSLLFAKLT